MKETNEQQLSYYCVIPAPVMTDGRLSSDEKILYGSISGMSKEKGYCWASNDRLASYFKDKDGKPKTKRTVINWLNHLEELGYIKRTIVFSDDNTNQIEQRRIYLTGKIAPKIEGEEYEK